MKDLELMEWHLSGANVRPEVAGEEVGRATFMVTQDRVNGSVPRFGHQLQLRSPSADNPLKGALKTKENIRVFLNGIYNGRDAETLTRDIVLRGKTTLLKKVELDYYAE
ncbi:MAG: hypothetical protein M1830_005595 [Pleopsidium flavum]|nr:MAG: hypothetical protein M1830_005595 [Pleopsidium flavum]